MHRTSRKPAQGLNAVILLECLLRTLPDASTGRLLSMASLERACQNSLPKVANSVQCMSTEAKGPSAGVTESISCREISPHEEGEERAELCHSGLAEVRGCEARLYT